MCMKQPSFILTLLIPCSKGPGNKVHVYMQPLIKELKDLWEIGVDTFDACKNESLQMPVAVMCTINDFPAYANMSRWSTKVDVHVVTLKCPLSGWVIVENFTICVIVIG